MRISADEADSGYCALLPNDNIVVTLDGVEVRKAVTADEEAGEVVRGVTDSSGAVRFEDDKFVSELLRGEVVIHTPAGFPRDPRKWNPLSLRLKRYLRRWYMRHVYFNPWFIRMNPPMWRSL